MVEGAGEPTRTSMFRFVPGSSGWWCFPVQASQGVGVVPGMLVDDAEGARLTSMLSIDLARSPGYDRLWTLKFKVPVTPVRRTSIRHEPVAPLDVVNVPVSLRLRL